MIEKVTAFIVRGYSSEVSIPAALGGAPSELLLLRHPFAGLQVPAGAVEVGESPEEAVNRESAEETGLADCTIVTKLGVAETKLPADQRIIAASATVFARPDATSFDWARIRRGIRVTTTGRRQAGFTQISYVEHDQMPDPNYITLQITGWVRNELLTDTQIRHFFLLKTDSATPSEWQSHTDNHTFTLFWTPLSQIPPLVTSQQHWLKWLEHLQG